jgi:hypothetical protein
MECSLPDAQRSILIVNAWLASVGTEIVTARANEQVLVGIEGVGKTLQEARRAERVIAPPIIDEDTGAVLRPALTVPDHATRLDAVRAAGEFHEHFTPKSKGTTLNVGVQTNVNNPSGAPGTRSFEQRVREKRVQRGLSNDATIPDAVVDETDAAPDNELEGEYIQDGEEEVTEE